MAAGLGQGGDGDTHASPREQALVERHLDAARRAGRVPHTRETGLEGDSRVVERMRDDQTERDRESLLNTPGGRSEMDVAVDQAGHHREMLGIDYRVRVAWNRAIADDVCNCVMLEDEGGVTDRLDAGTVDQGAAADGGGHEASRGSSPETVCSARVSL